MRIGVLNNLSAGKNANRVGRVLELLAAHPDVLSAETQSAQAVPDALSEFARRDLDLLVVNGGDGTLQHALTEILRGGEYDRIPMIAPLQGGRTNMTALDVGSHRDPVRGLDALLRDARAGRIAERQVRRPVLRIEARAHPVAYGMFFGAGMIHRAIALVHRLFPDGKSQGVLGAGMVTGTLIAKVLLGHREGVIEPDKAHILLDGALVPQGEFSLLIASTLQRLFLRMNPFWGREKAPVRFTALASGAARKYAALGILRGHPRPHVVPENGYTSRNVDCAELRLDCGYTVDGEIFAPLPDEIVTLTADSRVTFVRA